MDRVFLLYLVGISGSGKTTIANRLKQVEKTHNTGGKKAFAGNRRRCSKSCRRNLGRAHYVEVQRDNRGATPRRARRNTSMIDSNFPNSGKYGENLPELYLIFITEHDYWKKNKGLYAVNKTVSISETETIEYDDGSHVLYANGAYEGNDKIGELMHDFRTANPDEMHNSVLKDRTNYLKRNKQGVEFMCKAMDDLAEKRAMARVLEIANNMFVKGMTVEDISELLNISTEKVLELKRELVLA